MTRGAMVTTGYTQMIAIRTEDGVARVQAAVFGDWAAHPAQGEPGWCVSHVQHGRRLNTEFTEAQAKTAARLLCERIPVLRYRDGQWPHPDDVVTARGVIAEVTRLPTWFLDEEWLLCRRGDDDDR